MRLQKLYADFAKTIVEENNPEVERLKEVYNTIYGNLVFIREKAFKNFEEEITSSHNHHPHNPLQQSKWSQKKYVLSWLQSLGLGAFPVMLP